MLGHPDPAPGGPDQSIEIACQDPFGRRARTFLSLNAEGRAVVRPPGVAGTYDWYELDCLIAGLAALRKSMPGTPT